MPSRTAAEGGIVPIFLGLIAALGLAIGTGVRSAGVRPYAQRAGGAVLGVLAVVALAFLAQSFLARSLGDAVMALYLLLVGPGLSALVAGGVLAVEAVARRGVSASGLVRTLAAASLGALAWLMGFPLLFGQRTGTVITGWALALLTVAAWAAAAHGLGRGRRRTGRDRF